MNIGLYKQSMIGKLKELYNHRPMTETEREEAMWLDNALQRLGWCTWCFDKPAAPGCWMCHDCLRDAFGPEYGVHYCICCSKKTNELYEGTCKECTERALRSEDQSRGDIPF